MSERDDLGRRGRIAEVDVDMERDPYDPELEDAERGYGDPEARGTRVGEPEARRGTMDEGDRAPLFAAREADELRSRWESVQTSFVDEPRRAVEDADALVKAVLERLESGFSRERERLEREWSAGDRVSTEDLRVALQQYRSFFERLLSI